MLAHPELSASCVMSAAMENDPSADAIVHPSAAAYLLTECVCVCACVCVCENVSEDGQVGERCIDDT